MAGVHHIEHCFSPWYPQYPWLSAYLRIQQTSETCLIYICDWWLMRHFSYWTWHKLAPSLGLGRVHWKLNSVFKIVFEYESFSNISSIIYSLHSTDPRERTHICIESIENKNWPTLFSYFALTNSFDTHISVQITQSWCISITHWAV